MKISMSLASVLFIFLLLLIFSREAHAYLDPGSASYLYQLLIAGLLGASFAIKIYWRRIREFLSKSSSKEKDQEENEK